MSDKAPAPQKKWLLMWILIFGGSFVVLETIALIDPAEGDTLSESLRWLVYSPPENIGVIAFFAFFAWFIPHILKRRRDRSGGDEDSD
jgi:hypothetical protein